MNRDTKFAKTKIIGTIGPAISTAEDVAALIRSGMDIARLNFSHGDHQEHLHHLEIIKKGIEIAGSPLAILADLCGPKIRLGVVEQEFSIQPGESVVITSESEKYSGSKKVIPTEYTQLADDVNRGDSILIDDGLIQLAVREVKSSNVICEVIDGGIIKSRKGMNLPNVNVSVSAVTEKDMEDLDFIVQHDIDFVALSFVRSVEDIRYLRRLLKERNKMLPIIAKIEKPEAIYEINAIIKETDMVMVARGDLGVEMPPQEVPVLQKMIIKRCIEENKPVITATQMLDSMISNPRPTRAEASDVANAVFDRTDAVMLSGETSIGSYPLNAVRTMDQIIRSAEKQGFAREMRRFRNESAGMNDAESICRSACLMAEDSGARAIIVITKSGRTARLVSKFRPNVPIIAFSQSYETIKSLNIVWGVQGELIDTVADTDETLLHSKALALDLGYLSTGDKVVYVTGIPILTTTSANMIKIDVV